MYGYQWAVDKLEGRERRKLANHTYLERTSADTIAVRLHATHVVIYHASGDVVLNSGGWRTSTTKDRINNYSPIRITQAAGVWYVREDLTFADHMIVKPDGTLVGGGPDPGAVRRQRTKVRKFAEEFVRRLRAGEIPAPSGGDCWMCLFLAQGGKPDPEHVRDHMAHNYFVPSLLVNALNWRGSIAMRSLAYSRFQGGDPATGWPENDWLWRDIRKSLTRYCYLQLGMTV